MSGLRPATAVFNKISVKRGQNTGAIWGEDQVCSKPRIIAETTAPIKAETQESAAEMPKYTSTSTPRIR